jgi:hypothetical protein
MVIVGGVCVVAPVFIKAADVFKHAGSLQAPIMSMGKGLTRES